MHARSEILSALGIVAGFLVYTGSPRLRRFQVHLLPMAAGALAKTPAVLLAPLLFVWEVLSPGPPKEGSRGFATRVMLALRATAPGVRRRSRPVLVHRREDVAADPRLRRRRPHRVRPDPDLGLAALPPAVRPSRRPLGGHGPVAHPVAGSTCASLAGACALAALGWVALRCAKSPRAWPVTFGLAWFAIGLLPTSSVIPLAEPLNEHRVFLPYIGLVLSAVWGVRLILERRIRRTEALVATSLLILVALAIGTHARNRVWRTGESLWADVTEKSPGNGRAWMNYGAALMARGAYAKARECYERAAVFTPNYWALEINRAIVEDALGSPAIAEPHFKRAIELGPDPAGHAFLLRALAGPGRPRTGGRAAPRDGAPIEPGSSPGSGPPDGPSRRHRRRVGGGISRPGGPGSRSVEHAGSGLPERRFSSRLRARRGLRAEWRASPSVSAATSSPRRWPTVPLSFSIPRTRTALNNLGWTMGKLGYFAQGVAPLERALAIRPDFTLARNNLAWLKSRIP